MTTSVDETSGLEGVLQVRERVSCTTAEGPWERYALWVQGCSIRCRGCCNPHMFAVEGGQPMSVGEIVADVVRARRNHGIEGITVLGGEPFDQPLALAELVERLQALDVGVIVFSGYRIEVLRVRAGFERIWAAIDTLVDGPFVASEPESIGGRAFVGSANQRLLHRSPRYADAELWHGPRRIELTIEADGSLQLHGSPIPLRALLRAFG